MDIGRSSVEFTMIRRRPSTAAAWRSGVVFHAFVMPATGGGDILTPK
jgi:hypothetical protein